MALFGDSSFEIRHMATQGFVHFAIGYVFLGINMYLPNSFNLSKKFVLPQLLCYFGVLFYLSQLLFSCLKCLALKQFGGPSQWQRVLQPYLFTGISKKTHE